MPSAAGAASNGVATDGSPAALYARTASNSCGSGSLKTPGRVPLLPLSSVPVGRRTTSTTLRRVVWSAVATAAARAHPPLPPTLGSSRTVLPARVHQTGDTKKRHS